MSNAAQLTLEDSGNHHHASLVVDATNNNITGGAILNYAPNSSVALKINQEGQVSGTFVHSGNSHSLKGVVKSDGQFEGIYRDQKANVTITMKSGVAELTQGKLPETGVQVKGDHHAASLGLDAQGHLTGTLEAKTTNTGTYKLQIDKGEVTGSFVHQGEHHQTSIAINKDGWKGDLAISKPDQKWAVAVEKGKADWRVTGEVQLTF